ncbi:MAG: hypothetical protein AMS19_02565 [Gemmatimonas sp. SG8_23]|nr:MAG: hypothetical protein AMS19_02565 [Gemmatimonas sp. SG8_23]
MKKNLGLPRGLTEEEAREWIRERLHRKPLAGKVEARSSATGNLEVRQVVPTNRKLLAGKVEARSEVSGWRADRDGVGAELGTETELYRDLDRLFRTNTMRRLRGLRKAIEWLGWIEEETE